jgi:hypothetical protein
MHSGPAPVLAICNFSRTAVKASVLLRSCVCCLSPEKISIRSLVVLVHIVLHPGWEVKGKVPTIATPFELPLDVAELSHACQATARRSDEPRKMHTRSVLATPLRIAICIV